MTSELPDGWRAVTVRDIASDRGLIGGPFGSSLGTKDYVSQGVPVIRGSNLAMPPFAMESLVFVSQEKAESLARCLARPGDIVVTQRGTLGQVGRVPSGYYANWLVSQSQMALRVDPSRAEADFVYWCLRSPRLQQQIRDRAIVTGVPHINLGSFGQLALPLPRQREQRRIVAILGALDDKIDSNRRFAGLLKQMGAIYLAQIRLGGAEQMIALGDLTLTIRRGVTPKYCDDGGLLVVNQRCVRSGGIDFAPARRHDPQQRGVPDERMLSNGDVLVNSTGVGTLGRVGAVRWLPEPATADSHVTIVRPDPGSVEPEYLVWELLDRRDIEALAEGTTGQTELSRARLAGLPVVLPPRTEQRKFVALAEPLSRQAAALEREVLSLGQARDLLLPRLISGELRVPDTADPAEVIEPVAEEIAAAAT